MQLRTSDVEPLIGVAFDRMMAKAALADANGGLNTRPDLEGANSVYATVYHCTQVVDFWLDHVIIGNQTTRDREDEFVVEGSLADLEGHVGGLRAELPALLAAADAVGEPAEPDYAGFLQTPWSTDAVVLHIIDEIFQHAGHVDMTTDLVTRD